LILWDVFRSDRLELERGLTTEAIRSALARGELHDDDLVRPAGTTAAWARLADLPTFLESPAETSVPVPDFDDVELVEDDEAVEEEDRETRVTPEPAEMVEPPPAEDEIAAAAATAAYDSGLSRLDLDRELDPGERRHRVDLSSVELIRWDTSAAAAAGALEDEPDPLDEDEQAASFTLSRGGPEKVEELDLAAMVDVAFQLVLFFLVTATTILYKSLEVPRPNPETPAAGATQGKAPTLNDLKNDYILVEIDPQGTIKIDREPVASEMSVLVERLRAARESTGRKAMLLSADAVTPHRNAVLAYDAANEIGLGIAIARPAQKGDKAQ
jgi:biopolymer transport protein ExbD